MTRMEFEQERARQTERNFCQNANLPGGAGAAAPPQNSLRQPAMRHDRTGRPRPGRETKTNHVMG